MSGDYVCNICGKQFLTKGRLSSHNWAVHNTFESPCIVCDKIFTNKKHLAVHMSNTHAENQRFSCDFKTGESACSYYSTTKTNLTAHKKRVHEKTIDAIPPKHACVLCRWLVADGAISSGLGSARIIFFAFDSHDHFNGELHF